ncbi:hypothetical protein Tco_0547546 [Tanacetum coccineum]
MTSVAVILDEEERDVDEEREMEAPPGFRLHTPRGTERQAMEGIPPLLAAHLRETKRRRTMLPREASTAHRNPMHKAHHSSQQLYAAGGSADGRHGEANPMGNNMYPPNHIAARETKLRRGDRRKVSEKRTERGETDYGHDTNACRELKNQIEEAVKSEKLAHLINGIRIGRAKQADNQLREWAAPAVKTKPDVDGK